MKLYLEQLNYFITSLLSNTWQTQDPCIKILPLKPQKNKYSQTDTYIHRAIENYEMRECKMKKDSFFSYFKKRKEREKR